MIKLKFDKVEFSNVSIEISGSDTLESALGQLVAQKVTAVEPLDLGFAADHPVVKNELKAAGIINNDDKTIATKTYPEGRVDINKVDAKECQKLVDSLPDVSKVNGSGLATTLDEDGITVIPEVEGITPLVVADCIEKGIKPEKPKKFWWPFKTKKQYLAEHAVQIESRQGRLDYDENVIISTQTHRLHEKRGIIFAIKDYQDIKDGRALWFEYPNYHKRPLDELQFLKYYRWQKSKDYRSEIMSYMNYLAFVENFEPLAYTLEEMQVLEDTPRDTQITESLLKHLPVRLEVTDLEDAKATLLDMKTYFDQNRLSPDDMFRYTETVRILQERWDIQEKERLRMMASYEDKTKPAVEITNSMILDDPTSTPEDIEKARKALRLNVDKDRIDQEVKDLTKDMFNSPEEIEKQNKKAREQKAEALKKKNEEAAIEKAKLEAEEAAKEPEINIVNWGEDLSNDIDIFAPEPEIKVVTKMPEPPKPPVMEVAIEEDFGLEAKVVTKAKASSPVKSPLAKPVLLDPDSFEVKKAVSDSGVQMIKPLDLAPTLSNMDLDDLWNNAEI